MSLDDRDIALRRVLAEAKQRIAANEELPEIVKLRVSVARIAQRMKIDCSGDGLACAYVADKGYGELVELARTQERGWNELCRRICERIDEDVVQQALENGWARGE